MAMVYLCSLTLQRSSLRGSGGDNCAVLHGVVGLKSLDQLGNGGSLLTDGNVDNIELLLLVSSVVPPLLVQHGIEGDSGLSGLTIADDQLTLATADGHHCVDRLEASLYGLTDGGTGKNTRRLHLSTAGALCVERALSINGVSESVNDTAEKLLADWDFDLNVILVTNFHAAPLGLLRTI
jgi:hypothetical protein